MDVRAYALLPQTVLDAAAAPLRAAAANWAAGWGLPPAAVVCRRAWEQPATLPAWRCSVAHDGAGAQLAWRDDAPALLQRELFPPDRHYGPDSGAADMAAKGAVQAFDALVAAIGAAVCGAGAVRRLAEPVAPALLLPGSGAALLELRCATFTVWVLAEHATVCRLAAAAPVPERAPPLAPVDYRALLADVPVRLHIGAGRAATNLGSVIALAPGDVIRFDMHADQPLAVLAPDGQPLMRGYLGTQDQFLALEVVAGDPPSGEHA